jgi:hypothetical protein
MPRQTIDLELVIRNPCILFSRYKIGYCLLRREICRKLSVRRRERICRRPGLSFGVGPDLAQLNHLLARFNHGSPDLISAREQDTVTVFAACAPSPDRNLEIGKPGPQPLAEVTCLGQSAGR